MVKGNFLTEDSYLGDISNPLTLNRYSYCIGNPLFYIDPSGYAITKYEVTKRVEEEIYKDFKSDYRDFKYTRLNDYRLYELYQERINFYENRNYTEDWDDKKFETEEARIEYMVKYDFVRERSYVKGCEKKYKGGDTEIVKPSEQYIQFLMDYEAGKWDKWQYAEDLGDNRITISFGVVIKDENGKYPLGEERYNYYMDRKENNEPLSYDEAYDLMEVYMYKKYIPAVNIKAKEKGWVLTQGRFDALLDMTWNAGTGSLKYVASELLAMGDLTDDTVIKDLEREILETAHADIEGQGNVWTKNLVERRLDVIRIAKGDEEAYIRHEWTNKDWMEKGGSFLENKLGEEVYRKYDIQKVKVNN